MESGSCAREGCDGLLKWPRARYCSKSCAKFEHYRTLSAAHRTRKPYAPVPRVPGDISEAEIDRRYQEGLRFVRAARVFALDPHQRRGSTYDALGVLYGSA